MGKLGSIEIRVVGKSGNTPLSLGSYDIKQIAVIFQNVEDLLYPNAKRDRPLITYDLQEGSVKHLFKTSLQAVIGFSAVLAQIKDNNSIDFLELKTARALENIQNISRQKNYEFHIKTSLKEDYELVISPLTQLMRTEDRWVEAELYFYGILRNAGGKSKATIHLDTLDYGYLSVATGREFLKEQKENLLYKRFGVRALGMQHLETGEVDTKSLKLLELIDYAPKFDAVYLNHLIKRAKRRWKKINPEQWLQDIRGGYEA